MSDPNVCWPSWEGQLAEIWDLVHGDHAQMIYQMYTSRLTNWGGMTRWRPTGCELLLFSRHVFYLETRIKNFNYFFPSHKNLLLPLVPSEKHVHAPMPLMQNAPGKRGRSSRPMTSVRARMCKSVLLSMQTTRGLQRCLDLLPAKQKLPICLGTKFPAWNSLRHSAASSESYLRALRHIKITLVRPKSPTHMPCRVCMVCITARLHTVLSCIPVFHTVIRATWSKIPTSSAWHGSVVCASVAFVTWFWIMSRESRVSVVPVQFNNILRFSQSFLISYRLELGTLTQRANMRWKLFL